LRRKLRWELRCELLREGVVEIPQLRFQVRVGERRQCEHDAIAEVLAHQKGLPHAPPAVYNDKLALRGILEPRKLLHLFYAPDDACIPRAASHGFATRHLRHRPPPPPNASGHIASYNQRSTLPKHDILSQFRHGS